MTTTFAQKNLQATESLPSGCRLSQHTEDIDLPFDPERSLGGFRQHRARQHAPTFGQLLLFAIFRRADPLCIARWSVLSLLIKYCGSSFEA